MTTQKAFQIQLNRVRAIYDGSDGDATKGLYEQLNTGFGVPGVVAVNLLRASKASHRAKLYRGGIHGQGSYSSMAYDRKNWSIDNLCKALALHATTLSIDWGWAKDRDKRDDSPHPFVFYVEIPTGQVSFHGGTRLNGPDYIKPWDGARGLSHLRIQAWTAHLLSRTEPVFYAPAEKPAPEGDPWLGRLF